MTHSKVMTCQSWHGKVGKLKISKTSGLGSLGAFLSFNNFFYTNSKVLKFAALFLCPEDSNKS